MENIYKKIANIKLKISENCSEENKKIIEFYWERKGIELSNMPRQVKDLFSLTQSELTQLYTTYADILLYLFCSSCNSYEMHEVKNQSQYKKALRKQSEKNLTKFKCSICEKKEIELLKLKEIKRNNDFLLKLDNAIENKNWKNLTNFEKRLLGNCLIMDFSQLKSHYAGLLNHDKFTLLITALNNIEYQNLIILIRDARKNKIIDFKYVSKLSEHREEINYLEKEIENPIVYNNETNTLKFKLTSTEKRYHQESPMFSGIVNFKERIVIEPDVDYVFEHWQRADDNLYLTLTPKEHINKLPTQRGIPKLPKSKQKVNIDFLNNIGENL